MHFFLSMLLTCDTEKKILKLASLLKIESDDIRHTFIVCVLLLLMLPCTIGSGNICLHSQSVVVVVLVFVDF